MGALFNTLSSIVSGTAALINLLGKKNLDFGSNKNSLVGTGYLNTSPSRHPSKSDASETEKGKRSFSMESLPRAALIWLVNSIFSSSSIECVVEVVAPVTRVILPL